MWIKFSCVLQVDAVPLVKEEEPAKDTKEGVLIESQGETFVHKPAESIAQKLEVCCPGSISFRSICFVFLFIRK